MYMSCILFIQENENIEMFQVIYSLDYTCITRLCFLLQPITKTTIIQVDMSTYQFILKVTGVMMAVPVRFSYHETCKTNNLLCI